MMTSAVALSIMRERLTDRPDVVALLSVLIDSCPYDCDNCNDYDDDASEETLTSR